MNPPEKASESATTAPSAKRSVRASAVNIASQDASSKRRKDEVPRFGVMWEVMRTIGDMSLPFFFSSVHVQGQQHVPPSNTPLILCANHSNTILDVAMLASNMPERRPLHFWAKSGFFKSPITRFILTSSGNIKVDRRNKNNQSLFQGTFEAMKAGGAIALFPEGGSYTIPALANLKMGAAWAALEYSRYLQIQATQHQLQDDDSDDPSSGTDQRRPKTDLKILPAAVIFDDKSIFRSRTLLQFGRPLSLDKYIDEFLSAPLPSAVPSQDAGSREQDATVPPTPASMTRTNTGTSTSAGSGSHAAHDPSATPAQRAVARLTADLAQALRDLTFNAPDWTTFQAVRAARELIFELQPDSLATLPHDMRRYVLLSRSLMDLLTLSEDSEKLDASLVATSRDAKHALFVYSSLLHLADVDHVTLARMLYRYAKIARSGFWSALKSLLFRLPYYAPIYLPTLVPTYLLPNRLAHHFAGREEESLSSVKTLFSFGFTFLLNLALLFKMLQYARWSPPGLLVAVAALWFLHDLNRSTIDTAYGLVKQVRFAWDVYKASKATSSATPAQPKQSDTNDDSPTTSLFFYGTLVHPKILARVIGNSGSHLTVQNGVLPDAMLCHIKGQEYPGLIRTESIRDRRNTVKGTLVCGLTRQDLRCLDAFEDDEYTRVNVTVWLDPEAPRESNSTRIHQGGDSLPLHEILAALTPARIAQLTSSTETSSVQRASAQVYAWTASLDLLEPKVWEFDVFAKEHASRWVGLRWDNFDAPLDSTERVENEFEYEIVDRIRDGTVDATSGSTESVIASTASADVYRDAIICQLTGDAGTAFSIETVAKHLAEKPSIQYYVDQAFKLASTKRPPRADRGLIEALLKSRALAQQSLATLVNALESDAPNAKIGDAIDALRSEKARVLEDRLGSQSLSDTSAMWPFTPLSSETKKDI
ncbi:hypothetical protein BCV70DRAFT_166328 [Testicularia cyperi]|uniref:Phospholipid/glycerol acyltransferase domain-containing protein n=1 Tax=Testicularia cyperi TaxID=1882483 RepID=A0A317XKH6_9BASI|nr:hypothetical protein BCV70DRAFT_166328 [Testicularia cyperi]